MGSKLLSSDMLINDLLSPMVKAYTFHDYECASNLLFQLNYFLKLFGEAVDDLPAPINPDTTDIMERRNSTGYFKKYYEGYAPKVIGMIGQYQKDVLQYIKDERG